MATDNNSLDNGYPFRDDFINFQVKYKGKKYYFEFPILMDRSFLLREIKTRTGVRRAFCLRWKKPAEVENDKSKSKDGNAEKTERKRR